MMKVHALCEMPVGVSVEDLHMLWFEGAPPEEGRDYCENVAHMNAAEEWDRVCNEHLEHSEYVRARYGPH